MPDTAVEECDSVKRLALDEWQTLLTPGDFYLSSAWLQVAEATAAVPMRYLSLRRDGRLVAGLATALADAKAPWVLGRHDTMLRAAARAQEDAAALLADLADPGALLPGLVCGGRHMGRTRVLTGPDAAPCDTAALVEAAERLAAEQGAASVAFPFVDEMDAELTAVLEARGYRSFIAGRYSDLLLSEPGWDAYLARLPKKRRWTARDERARLTAANVTHSVVPLDPADFARFGVLEAQLMAKYEIAWSAEQTVAGLHALHAAMGGDALASVAYADGEIRGFAVLLRFRDRWYVRNVGFDYAWQDRLPLYFEVLFYGVVDAAARNGVTAVHYGLGTEQAKRLRGCTATTQRCHLLPLTGSAR